MDRRRRRRESLLPWSRCPRGTWRRWPSCCERSAALRFAGAPDIPAGNGDGSLTVRFEAGGIDEMRRYLATRGKIVMVQPPAHLGRRLTGICESLVMHQCGS